MPTAPAKKANKKKVVSPLISAKLFIEKLKKFQSADELRKIQRYFKSGEGEYSHGDKFIGVRMGQVFALAKEFIELSPSEIAELLDHEVHEVRVGAVSIMDFQARNKKTPESRRKELFDLYIKKHDRINNWDLVDRSAPYVIGSYLENKPRAILYKLARSPIIWERRTAILSTAHFIRKSDTEDVFRIAEILINDTEDLIHKATGWMLRFAGDKDRKKLLAFLDRHAATMPRTLLRYAIEKLEKKQKAHYMGLKSQK